MLNAKKMDSKKIWNKLAEVTRKFDWKNSLLEMIDEKELLKLDDENFGENLVRKNRYKDERNQNLKIRDFGAEAKREKPRYPDPDDCCGSNCLDCVYVMYEKDLEDYEKWCLVNGDLFNSDEFYSDSED